MEYTIIAWLLISLIIGIIGDKRKIGFGGAFLYSIFLSPIIGAIFVANSKEKKNINQSLIKLNKTAISFKSKDIDKSIELLDRALKINSKSPRTNYNIACCYSLKKNKEKAFYHLSNAIKNNSELLNPTKKDSDLTWLREQEEFKIFIENGYTLDFIEEMINKDKPAYITELKELKKLKDEGVINEYEFNKKKEEILKIKSN